MPLAPTPHTRVCMDKQWADHGQMLPYAGWYCVGCEEYKQDDEIDEQHNCPTHRKPCVHREEENFFFKLSNYQKQLEVSTSCSCCSQERHISFVLPPVLAQLGPTIKNMHGWQGCLEVLRIPSCMN